MTIFIALLWLRSFQFLIIATNILLDILLLMDKRYKRKVKTPLITIYVFSLSIDSPEPFHVQFIAREKKR